VKLIYGKKMHIDGIAEGGNHHLHGNSAMVIPVTAVLPQQSSPILQHYRIFQFHYREFCRGYRSITIVPVTMQLSKSDASL